MIKKIAFWRTVGDSFNFVFEDWGRFFRLSAGWGVIVFVVFAAALALVGPKAMQMPSAGAHEQVQFGVARGIASFVLIVAIAVGNIAFAVAWHRAVLLGEKVEPLQALRFRGREVRFFLYALVLALIYMAATIANVVIGVLLGFLADGDFSGGHMGGWGIALAVLWVIVVAVAAAPFLARLSLGFAAVAVEEPRGVLRRSWHRGWRNGWRLIWGPTFCYLPMMMASGFLSGLQTLSALLIGLVWWASVIGIALDLVLYALVIIANFLAIALGVSFLSLSFRQLARERG